MEEVTLTITVSWLQFRAKYAVYKDIFASHLLLIVYIVCQIKFCLLFIIYLFIIIIYFTIAFFVLFVLKERFEKLPLTLR